MKKNAIDVSTFKTLIRKDSTDLMYACFEEHPCRLWFISVLWSMREDRDFIAEANTVFLGKTFKMQTPISFNLSYVSQYPCGFLKLVLMFILFFFSVCLRFQGLKLG